MATKEQQRVALACRLLGESKVLEAEARKREAEAKAIIDELIPPDEKGVLESRTYGRIKKTFQERLGIDPSSEDPLRAILGDRFSDFVTRTVALTPTDRMKNLLPDADDPTAQAVRPHVELKVSPSVRFAPAPGMVFLPTLGQVRTEEPAGAPA
ncbi:MAG: hypothetical protein NTW26_07100 [bacterium]|nr:hypothetical protein [bacterium]